MSPAAEDELQVLAAIYCEEGEFVADSTSTPARLTFNFRPTEVNRAVKFTCCVSEDYPARVPTVQVLNPDLEGSVSRTLQSDLETFVRNSSLLGEPMLSVVVEWIKEFLVDFCKQREHEVRSEASAPTVTWLLTLDHMRSKSKYSNILKTWASDLCIRGMLVFYSKHIFMVLHGDETAVKQFICNQRTRNVDVDASGKPCKERMLRVLAQDECVRFSQSGFDIFNFESRAEVKETFYACGLASLFDKHLDDIL